MQRNVFHRTISFCLAAVMTVGLLGAVDRLAQPDAHAAQLAQTTSTRA